MKSRLIIPMVLVAMLLMVPASADLFDDMDAAVPEYNEKIDQVPGTLRGILADQHVVLAVYMNNAEDETTGGPEFDVTLSPGPFVTESGVTMKVVAVTDSDASVVDFGRWSELDDDYNWDGVPFAETILVTTNEDTARALLDSETPGDTFRQAYDAGLITIEASEDASMGTKISLAIMPLVMKIYGLIG
ncbi:hypothetical protein LI82_05140 [Methanococcoides methylutens]|uniref:Uncharacterized protein n=1 Tax=Methanococcoides methylutens TaxID=2226 RepID=A0A099T3A9_METMT|nr:hypothetical protein [Methanococcoides methylutens]KGK99384.1 hypothetical protein LI82_05140 [Methanococcoides methylutens]